MRTLAIVLVACWLTLSLWQAPRVRQQSDGQSELRGIWLTNYGALLTYYTTQLDETVATLAKHHLNTLYPAVWNRGKALHRSRVLQHAQQREAKFPVPWGSPPDPLAGLVHQAHRQHLRIIPWFEYGLWVPTSSAIAQAHPDWLTTTQTGRQTLDSPPSPTGLPPWLRAMQQEWTGSNQAWLNPCHPGVQQFLIDLVTEVVQNYEVDGIQLDDHFGLPHEFGYDPLTQKQYRQEHQGLPPPHDPQDPAWVAWRAEKITQLMVKLVEAVRQINPQAVISLSPHPPQFAYQRYLQAWPHWIELGLIDEVVVQLYRPTLSSLRAELSDPTLLSLASRIPLSVGLYTGPIQSPKSIDQIQQEVDQVRTAGYRGVAFFCWETTLWIFKASSATRVQQTFEQLFASPHPPSKSTLS
ncbi:glycoside hydrolase family 10 protein [Lyngbya confervoides]|uniref:Family 10 glycosylhydrolase n=1 Tax=Lyngbya confervoides BDU141951 TaxID=1574623 RepID=A0ABD4TA52_9CYAN|nr:family 10 glycosylhydrolase [Lyngbya confervoides]MCM1985288.1 family 10 glycosylhydrolase [Lyngbya confervoides BDU141951]